MTRKNPQPLFPSLSEVKRTLYGLLVRRGVRIETNETVEYANFCCLKIRRYPQGEAILVTGRFTDELSEVLFVAHEYGHLLHYEALSPDDKEMAYCAVFASNHIGLENVSREGRELITSLEKKASEYALDLLKGMLDTETVAVVSDTYNKWIRGYYRTAGLAEGGDIQS